MHEEHNSRTLKIPVNHRFLFDDNFRINLQDLLIVSFNFQLHHDGSGPRNVVGCDCSQGSWVMLYCLYPQTHVGRAWSQCESAQDKEGSHIGCGVRSLLLKR
jgi:hypothetical protein